MNTLSMVQRTCRSNDHVMAGAPLQRPHVTGSIIAEGRADLLGVNEAATDRT